MLRRAAHGSRRGCDKSETTERPAKMRRGMCGIGAILDPAGAARPRRRLSAWSRRCATAGPTATRVRRIGPATLAHTRLAIIDVAGGDQPLVSEDGAVDAGRQRRDLQPPRPARRASRSAATASPPAPTARPSCTPTRSTAPTASASLNGIFAFALWDDRRQPPRRRARRVRRQAALLVQRRQPHRGRLRDRRAARRPAWPTPELDRMALDHYLACRFVPAPRTLFKGVQQAPGRLDADRRGGPAAPRSRPGATRPASPTGTSPRTTSPTSSPSASPTRSSAR